MKKNLKKNKIFKCKNCHQNKFIKIVNLGKQPLSGIFPKKKFFNLKKYSMDLLQCKKCKLVQLKEVANSYQMFGKDYEYSTALSSFMINHIKKKYIKIKKEKIIKKSSKILDVGSNDGTFLNFFNNPSRLFGIDPSAKKFSKNYKKKSTIMFDFFSKKKILQNLKKDINFDLITSFAMFYDVSDPNSFCADINELLTPEGLWILEISYLPLMLKNLTYDQICHEHVTFYTLTVFKSIIEKNNLKIVDINFNEINGGSAEIICAKKNSRNKPNYKKIKLVLNDEKKIKMNSFNNFNNRIKKTKKLIKFFFNSKSNKKIIGYGASTKGNIILNHCGITNKQIQYICDGSARKNNRFTPGSNIKIISKESMRKKKPDYIFVLIWSFRNEVIRQEIEYLKSGGSLVFPLPRFHIVNQKNYKNYVNENFSKFSFDY